MTREDYLRAVEEQIRCKKARPMVRKELEDHIQDQRDAYIVEGNIGREAEEFRRFLSFYACCAGGLP